MSNDSKIREALSQLDVANDNHWTADGLPRLDTVKMLAADQSITREHVNAALPGFTRNGPRSESNQTAGAQAPQAAEAPKADPVASSVQAAAPAAESAAPAAESAQTDLEKLRESVREQELLIERMDKHKAEFDTAYREERQKLDDLRARLQESEPEDGTPQAIRNYLDAQQKILAQRAQRKALIRESGIPLKELAENLRAPIDSRQKQRR